MNDKIRVTQVLYSGLGGHGSVVFSLIDGDIHGMWDNSLIFYGVEPLQNEYIKKTETRNITHQYIKANEGRPWRSWLMFYRALKITRPSFILLHSNTLLLPAWLYCKKNNVTLLFVEHTSNQVKRKFDLFISKLAQLMADKVISLTPAYKDELQKVTGNTYKFSKNAIIGNGVDISFFSQNVDKKINRPIQLGMAARFSIQRDQLLLVCVAKELDKKLNGNFVFKLAGSGDMLLAVQKAVVDEKLQHCVQFVGHLNEVGLLQFYHELDIYIHASKGEAMSTAIIQAMACGLPVIASDIPGINNMVHSGGGILVDNKVENFVKAILKLAQSDNLRLEMGKKNRQIAERELSHYRMFKNYDSIIGSL